MITKRNYLYESTLYEGTITRKRIRSLILRADPLHHKIRVSAPLLTSDKAIDDFVSKHLPRLLKRITILPSPSDATSTYIFGQKQEITFLDHAEEVAYLKKIGLPYLEEKVRHYESIMGIAKPYKIHIRDMKSRYGSNSKKTHSLCFASVLFHYSPAIIDSVIVHELAHDKERNHGKAFYKVVYTYCPYYKEAHRKLRTHVYA